MNVELNKAFDKELKKELNRGRRVWFLLALGVILILMVYTPVFSTTVQGETIGVSVKDRGGEPKFQLKVKLDTGKVITIIVSNDVHHISGRKVELSKTTSVVGMATYQFIQYVE